MKLILNENMPMTAVVELRARGHDVVAVKETLRGSSDTVILAQAQLEQRLVVSQDKDFGELAFRQRLPADCGIILFRLSGNSPEADVQRIVSVIESRSDWEGQFAVATDDRIRLRPLPPRKPSNPR